MAVENIIIDFQADYASLEGAIDTLAKLGLVDKTLAQNFKQTNAEINKQADLLKKSAQQAGGLTKSIEEVDKATKSTTKAFVEGFQEGVQDALKEAGVSVIAFRRNLGLINKDSPFTKLSKQLSDSEKKILEASARLQQLSATGGKGTEVFNKLEKQLVADRVEFKRLSDQMEATKAALDFSEPLKNTSDSTETLRTKLKNLTAQLQQLQFDGEENTEEFKRLTIEAGKVGDAIDEVNNQIKNSRDGEKTINSLVNAATTLAGGFAAVQGAAALFGEEGEEMQETLLKVNASMAILQGLQGVVVGLQSDGAITLAALNLQQKINVAQTNLATAAESKNIVVRGAAIVAQKALNAVMSANPIGLVITALLAISAALVYFTSKAKDAAIEQGKLNAALSSASELLDAEVEGYENANRKIVSDLEARGAKESQVLRQSLNTRKSVLTATEREIAQLRKTIDASANADTEEARKRLTELEREAQKQRVDIYVEENNVRSTLLKEQEEADKAALEKRKAAIDASIAKERERLEQAIAGYKIEQINLDETTFKWRNLQKAINDNQAALDKLEESGNKAKLILALAAEENRKLFTPPLQELEEGERKRDMFIGTGLRKRINAAKAINAAEKTFIVDTAQAEAAALAIREQNYAEFVQNVQKMAQIISAVYQQISSSLTAISNEQNQAIEITMGNQRKQIEEQLKFGQITEKEAAQRNARIDAQERVLKTRQAQRDKQIAIFNAVIGTAQAIVQALTAGPIIGPILAAVVGALGAAQVAAISARPIPKFKHGKKGNYEGPGIIGDAGAELVERNGQLFIANKPTITWLGKKDKVFTHLETKNILQPTTKIERIAAERPKEMDYEKLGAALAKHIPGGTEINIDKGFIRESVHDGLMKNNYWGQYYSSRK